MFKLSLSFAFASEVNAHGARAVTPRGCARGCAAGCGHGAKQATVGGVEQHRNGRQVFLSGLARRLVVAMPEHDPLAQLGHGGAGGAGQGQHANLSKAERARSQKAQKAAAKKKKKKASAAAGPWDDESGRARPAAGRSPLGALACAKSCTLDRRSLTMGHSVAAVRAR